MLDLMQIAAYARIDMHASGVSYERRYDNCQLSWEVERTL